MKEAWGAFWLFVVRPHKRSLKLHKPQKHKAVGCLLIRVFYEIAL